MKMKKCALALLLCMGIGQAAFSQDVKKETEDDNSMNPKFGLKISYVGAYNTADFYGSAGSKMSAKSGIGGGAFLDIPFSKSWEAQLGLNFAPLGTKLTGDYMNQTFPTSNTQNIKYNYITIPLLARYNVGQSGLTVMAGPQFGVLISAKQTNSNNNTTDVKAKIKSNDFAGIGGLEYKLPLHNFDHQVRVGVTYQAGLSNVIKDISTNGNNKMYNNAFSGYVAFVF